MYIYIPIYQSYHIPLSTRRLALALLGTGTALRPALQGAEANTLEQVTTLLRNIHRSISYPKFMTYWWNSSVTAHVSHQFISILILSQLIDKVVAPLASIDASQCFTVCPWRSWSSRGEREMTTSLNIPCSVLFHVPCSTDLCAEDWSLKTGICRNMQKSAEICMHAVVFCCNGMCTLHEVRTMLGDWFMR